MFLVILPWLFTKNFRGLAIFPFIFLKEKELSSDLVVINHERIHLRQQLELLWVGFFLWYGIEFLIRWIQYGNSMKAYFNISFEREAYAQESDLNYLKTRKFWSFASYL